MKNQVKSLTYLLTYLLIGFFALSSEPVKAQCPDASWTDFGCHTLTIVPGCKVQACYCVKNVNGIDQFWIRSVKIIDKTSCPNMTYQDAIGYAESKLATLLANLYGPCVDGGNPGYTYQTLTSTCWKVINTNPNPFGQPEYICQPCPGESGQCTILYGICGQGGIFQVWEISRSFIPGSCTLEAPFNWEPNVCYVYNLCDN